MKLTLIKFSRPEWFSEIFDDLIFAEVESARKDLYDDDLKVFIVGEDFFEFRLKNDKPISLNIQCSTPVFYSSRLEVNISVDSDDFIEQCFTWLSERDQGKSIMKYGPKTQWHR